MGTIKYLGKAASYLVCANGMCYMAIPKTFTHTSNIHKFWFIKYVAAMLLRKIWDRVIKEVGSWRW